MMSYTNIMESMSEHLPNMKCSCCKVSRELPELGPNSRNGCFKTCTICRASKKKSRDNKAKSNSNQGSNPESELVVSSSSASVLTINGFLNDGWANMTAELLEPLMYEERCAIHIEINTVVTRLNIFSYVKILTDIVVATPPYLLRKLGLVKLEPLWTRRLLRFIYQTEADTSL